MDFKKLKNLFEMKKKNTVTAYLSNNCFLTIC